MDCVVVDYRPSKGLEYTSKHRKRDLKVKCPLSYATSRLCDHNGGVLTSKDGDLKLTIPKGAIKEGDLVTLSIASDLYGPFVLPSKCQADVVSPYYWVAVSELYHFQKPVQVKFQHFAVVTACDPLHYQLLYCEDDDESHTMQPVATDCSPRFTVQDDISWCTFYTNHFCSYCLYHGCKDPIINRIATIYLKMKDSHQFTKEIWFSFPIAQCLKRNEELYTKRGMVLVHGCGHIFEAPCNKSSTNFFTLTYHQDFDGWDVKHCPSNTIATKEINFYNYYKTKKDLKAVEKVSLFPQRFVINVTKKSECSTDLNTDITISLHKNEEEILKSISFPLFIPVSQFADRLTTSTASIQIDPPPVSEIQLLAQEAKMRELIKCVIPKILAEWETVAFSMRYDPNDVQAFKKDAHDANECCKKLFIDWITTGHGPTPKTYQTLLYHIKEIDNLKSASEAIEKELIKALRQ